MFSKTRPISIVLLGGFLFFLDRMLKWAALNIWTIPLTLKNFFGWQPYLNKNAAFGAPLPNIFILLLAVPTLCLVLLLLIRALRNKNTFWPAISYTLIFFGGLSNLLDRFINRATTDYLLIFTGIINLADIMITVGLLALVIFYKKSGPDCSEPL